MPSAEQCRPFLGHDTPYQISSIAFATEPIWAGAERPGTAHIPFTYPRVIRLVSRPASTQENAGPPCSTLTAQTVLPRSVGAANVRVWPEKRVLNPGSPRSPRTYPRD
jgi:hypothetical protein